MSRIKVLLVDDEEEFCKALKLILEETGKFEVLTATRGAVGFQLAKSKKPDVIILDIVMPDMTGTEVAEALLEDNDTKHIPIIFLTALLKKHEEESFRKKFTKYHILAKPVNTDDLISRIRDIVS
jgi:CheY-like chemotaxis protein